MKTNIVYFTRSGKTALMASKLNSMVQATLYPVTDDMNWKGIWGYLKGGFYASSNKPVNIQFDASALDCDQLVIFSPLWAGGAAPAIRTFMNKNSHKNIILVLTNDGSDVKKAFTKIKALHPDIKYYFGITKKYKNEDEILDQIKEVLRE